MDLQDGSHSSQSQSQPLFPRLHLNETSREAGPRAPPRNKMALYEQFTVPSHRFEQHQTTAQQQQQQHQGGAAPGQNFVPQPQAFNGCYYVPYYMVPPPMMYQPVIGQQNAGIPDTETTESELQQVPGASSASGKLVTVPSMQSRARSSEKLKAKATAPPELDFAAVPTLRSKSAAGQAAERVVGSASASRAGDETAEQRAENRVNSSPSRSDNEGRARVVDNQSEEEGFGPGDVEEASEDSATSILENSAPPPVGNVPSFGDEKFLSVRKAMQRQQNIFQKQLFELHRLTKVQQLMANHNINDQSESRETDTEELDIGQRIRDTSRASRAKTGPGPNKKRSTQAETSAKIPTPSETRVPQHPAPRTPRSPKPSSEAPAPKPLSQAPAPKPSSRVTVPVPKSTSQAPAPKPSSQIPAPPSHEHNSYNTHPQSMQAPNPVNPVNPVNYGAYHPAYNHWYAPVPMQIPYQQAFPVFNTPYYGPAYGGAAPPFVPHPIQLQPWQQQPAQGMFYSDPAPRPWMGFGNHPEPSLQASSTCDNRSDRGDARPQSQAGSSGFSLIQRADSSPAPTAAVNRRQQPKLVGKYTSEGKGGGGSELSPYSRPSGFQTINRRGGGEGTSSPGAIKVTPRAAGASAESAVEILQSIQQQRSRK